MYISIYIVPVNRPWRPTQEFISQLMGHFSAKKINYFVGYMEDAPYGYGEEEIEEVFDREDVTTSECLNVLEQKTANSYWVDMSCEEWTDRSEKELLAYTKSFFPSAISFRLGENWIPDETQESSLFKCYFSLSLSGDGDINGSWKSYLDYIKKHQLFLEIFKFLKEQSGEDWEIYLSGS